MAAGEGELRGVEFRKGHGTHNDFILLPDPAAVLELTPSRVRALTDRQGGIGADGVLRVIPTSQSGEFSDQADRAKWFMDYRNADGSTAEMCGNGARVFGRFLVDEGLESTTSFSIATRGGVRELQVDSDEITVEIGPATVLAPVHPIQVTTGEGDSRRPGWSATGVLVPNPHAVAFVDDLDAVGELRVTPEATPVDLFPHGVNIEFVQVIGRNHVKFRVFERGVGETRSCGTGAVAVAFAYRQAHGSPGVDATVTVDVPGGRLRAFERPDGHWLLAGPVHRVAAGMIDAQWWKDNK